MHDGTSAENLTVRDWARTIRDVEGTGDYFQAFEVARKAIGTISKPATPERLPR